MFAPFCLLARRSVIGARLCAAASGPKGIRGSARLFSTAHTAPNAETPVIKESLSPFSRHLYDMINLSGPISVAQFMRQILINPLSGYYMHRDVFGKQGDFVTSPEISQTFGEILAVWLEVQWDFLGRPPKIKLVELGPGKGTLMTDIMRALWNFKGLHKSIESIHLVEASPHLRQIQQKALCAKDEPLIEGNPDDEVVSQGRARDGKSLMWHSRYEDVPQGCHFVIAHEFFDALPIYKFQKTKHGWREIMIDVDTSPESEFNFRYVLAPAATRSSSVLMSDPSATARFEPPASVDVEKDAWQLELSPESVHLIDRISTNIHENSGCCLIVDYGTESFQSNSIRAIRNHKFCHVFSQPGTADISVDVDFGALFMKGREKADVFGPMTQGNFLRKLGIETRMQILAANKRLSETAKRELESGVQRLIAKNQMGQIYKVMALTPKASRAPVPFQDS